VNKNSKRFITLSLHECGFAHLFLLVVIVVIGIVGLLYYSWQKGMMKTAPTLDLFPTPTPDTYISGNWKAYENDYWGFKLKYPIDSFVACGNISEKEGLRLWKTPFECPEGHDILSSISVIGYKPGDFNPKHTIILSQKIQVAGVENNLYKYEYYESDGPLYVLKESTVFVISLNDRTLEIAYHGINEKDKEIFFNILDTVELYDSRVSQSLQKLEEIQKQKIRNCRIQLFPVQSALSKKGLQEKSKQSIFQLCPRQKETPGNKSGPLLAIKQEC